MTLTNDLGSDGSGSSEEVRDRQDNGSKPHQPASDATSHELPYRQESEMKFTTKRVKVVDANALLPRVNQLERVVSHSNIKEVKLNGYIVEGGSEGDEESDETDDDDDDEDEDDDNDDDDDDDEHDEEGRNTGITRGDHVSVPLESAVRRPNSPSTPAQQVSFTLSTVRSSCASPVEPGIFSFNYIVKKQDVWEGGRNHSHDEDDSENEQEGAEAATAHAVGDDDDNDAMEVEEEEPRPFVSPTMVVEHQILLVQPKRPPKSSEQDEDEEEEDEEEEEEEEDDERGEDEEEENDQKVGDDEAQGHEDVEESNVIPQRYQEGQDPQHVERSRATDESTPVEDREYEDLKETRVLSASTSPQPSNDSASVLEPGPPSAVESSLVTSLQKSPSTVTNQLSKAEEERIRQSLEKKRMASNPSAQAAAQPQNPNVVIRYVVIKGDDDDDDDEDGEYTYEEVDDDDEDEGAAAEPKSPTPNGCDGIDELRMNQLNTIRSRNH